MTDKDVETLIASVRRQGLDIVDAPPNLIGEGISTLTYGLTSPDGDWVLRVSRRYPTPWTWRGGREHEVALLAGLRRRGVPVAEDATVIECVDRLPAAILERRVTGTPLTTGLVACDERLTRSIAALLDNLHTLALDTPLTQAIPRDDAIAEFREALTVVDLQPGLRSRVETALGVLEDRRQLRVLCHRDFRVEHLFVEAGEVVGLLDLGEVGVDDPAVDLAFLHGELGGPAVEQICAAMTTADPGLSIAAATIHALWPLLELAPGGETWGDPATAYSRLDALV